MSGKMYPAARKAFLKISVAAFILNAGACTTSVPIQVVKLPNIDTSGIKRLAVMPFSSSAGRASHQVAQALTVKARRAIQDTGAFTLVDDFEVERRRNAGESLSDYVDGVFIGEITEFSSKDASTYFEETKHRDAYTEYTREVRLSIACRIVRARDGSVAGSISKSGSEISRGVVSFGDLASPFTLAQGIINGMLATLYQDVAPWSRTERRALLEEESKDKEIKLRMKAAKELTRKGNYKAAQRDYEAIYRETGGFAAGYNAAILTEITGDLPGAIERMRLLEGATGNPKASRELERMRRTQTEGQAVAEKFGGAGGAADKAVKQASEEIIAALAEDSAVSILNVSQTEKELAEYSVEEITAAVVNGGKLTVVDRKNQFLIDAEQQFQLSGAVGDASAVSIGKRLGVHYIALCSISGSGYLRRLAVRIVSVETGEVLRQTSFEI
jgi:TolB-like protein